MSSVCHPYAGRRAVIATMHRKEEVIGPALLSALSLSTVLPRALNTDQLGTFSGEIPRQGTMLDVAVQKARLGMRAAALPLGIASEGSFGPHPRIPLLAAGQEILVFVDDDAGLVVREGLVTTATNFDYLAVAPDETLEPFLERVGFPEHGLLVRPNDDSLDRVFAKGITDRERLAWAIGAAARLSADGRARIETDMRAHLNPTRMKLLAVLARKLAQRLACLCPACSAPGFGRSDVRAPGLRCEECGTATEMAAVEIHGCAVCGHRAERPRADGLKAAPARHCPVCNP